MIATDTFEIELIEWASGQIGAPCQWGENDCMQLALQAVDIMLNASYAVDIGGDYTDEAGARAQLEVISPGDFLESLGFYEIDLAFARVGDIVIAETDDFPACAHVVLGSTVLSGQPGAIVRTYPKRALKAAKNRVVWGLR